VCRFVAYLGPPVTLESLLLAPPHSLLRQSYEPRHQRHGRINADGFGVGWYAPEVRATPAHYRSTAPMWSDRSFESFAGVVRSGAVLAAVRNATPGLATDESNTPPYAHDHLLFAHNGRVAGFPGPVAARLRDELSDERTADLQGSTDSEVLFALVLDELARGAALDEAVRSVVGRVQALAPGSRLNVVLSDGTTVVATAAGDSLFTREGTDDAVVASEPFDDEDGWVAVGDGSVVVAVQGSIQIGAL